ncbi:MAG: excinuclease ABC subunit C [Deltaproteobacteria bacterium]|nr:MAG: excinuclease ABC subunit C [Deltaproteobacteria bacterium]
MQIEEKLETLPTSCGVYLFKDSNGEILYVGKAKNLRTRIRSYFHRSSDSLKIRTMVSKLSDIETIVTDTEKEALILENNLIKKYKPRYNVVFRDDKTYPYLRLSLEDTFPALYIVRRPKKDNSRYFGPFASVQAVKDTQRLIYQIFTIRRCHRKRFERDRPCIYYQLGQCLAPCSKNVDPSEYNKIVKEVELFLEGRSQQIINSLKQRMKQEAEKLNFETAARLRDRIEAIEKTLEKQKIVSLELSDRDVFGFFRENEKIEIVILFVRNGRIIGKRNYSLSKVRLSDEESLESFVSQYYHSAGSLPQEIILPKVLPNKRLLEQWLTEKKGKRVRIVCPKKGDKYRLLLMAEENAKVLFQQRAKREALSKPLLEDLKERLHLRKYPYRVEGFDISNIMAKAAVGSMVCFIDGEPYKEGYRRFRIKTVTQIDDYAMMYEILNRHLRRKLQEGNMPDLIVVDGGKGQLNVALRVMKELNIKDLEVIALAKGRKEGKDKVFLPFRKDPINIAQNSPSFHFLQRIRDEAHRFAISYHKVLKRKQDFASPLQSIPGIGPKTAKRLLTYFGSLKEIKEATLDDLKKIPFLSSKKAEAIYEFFKNKQA